MVVTDISLVGWLVSSADAAPTYKVLGALVAVVVITAAGIVRYLTLNEVLATSGSLNRNQNHPDRARNNARA